MKLDDVDRGILHLLQEDARNKTAAEMAEQVGVSASTVRNRIEALEDEGVICGYHPEIDYEQAEYQLHMVIICHAPVSERAELVDTVMELEGVVTVREMLTGDANIHVEAIGTNSSTVDQITSSITDLGLEIESVNLVKEMHVQPFNHFGESEVTD
ncbi:transcriptional regulator [Natronococcus pandeyae]|uniref:Transcriptional regulator n=1 Tax=Natronococcus pandeyae TaxID=2055836 RepID=A0A8J8Q6B2_9EURY|nr:Lrp/AsnC family transcriptional regulator [Natronococcus pandeyae]TYL39612.1 transcriptional regulator [Natronococcus pandeyae]